jgi:two-component system LytT family response regulator
MIFSFDNGTLQFKTTDREKFAEFVSSNGLTKDDLKRYLQKIPVIKYYNVFRADDCTGLKFPEAVGNKKVNPANVLFLKADVNYTELFMQGGETLIVSKTLKELEKQFIPFNFFRTHKSFMVNLNYVIGYQIHEGLLVKLDGEYNVNLSRRRKEDFLKSFHNFPNN